MREIVYQMIAGNPNIKQEGKPKNAQDILRLSIDKKEKVIKQKSLTAKELEDIKNELLNKLNK